MLRKIGALFIVLVALLTTVILFSSVQTRYECCGQIKFDNKIENIALYVKLEEYRWWVGLWSEADGSLNIEIPNQHVDYFSHLVEVGDQLQIYENGSLAGNLSTLSKTLALKTALGFFDGTCKIIDK